MCPSHDGPDNGGGNRSTNQEGRIRVSWEGHAGCRKDNPGSRDRGGGEYSVSAFFRTENINAVQTELTALW